MNDDDVWITWAFPFPSFLHIYICMSLNVCTIRIVSYYDENGNGILIPFSFQYLLCDLGAKRKLKSINVLEENTEWLVVHLIIYFSPWRNVGRRGMHTNVCSKRSKYTWLFSGVYLNSQVFHQFIPIGVGVGVGLRVGPPEALPLCFPIVGIFFTSISSVLLCYTAILTSPFYFHFGPFFICLCLSLRSICRCFVDYLFFTDDPTTLVRLAVLLWAQLLVHLQIFPILSFLFFPIVLKFC